MIGMPSTACESLADLKLAEKAQSELWLMFNSADGT
jgi:hypothetical protein